MSSKFKETTEEAVQTLVIELLDQRPSNFKLDENAEEHDKTTSISAPRALKVLNTSAILVFEKDPKDTNKQAAKKWRLIRTRYIKGCELFRVDEQDAQGWKPNPLADVIWLKDGKVVINDAPENRDVFNYLTRGFNGNTDIWQDENTKRPENAPDMVHIISTAADAKLDEAKFDLEDKAVAYVQSLRKAANGGYEYNADALEFISTLFKLEQPDNGYASAEAWVAVRQLAKNDPADFLSKIDSKRSLIEEEVRKAIGKGVIEVNAEKAFLGKTGKILLQFKGQTTDEERIELIIDLLSNPDKAMYLDAVRVGNKVGVRAETEVVL